MLPEIFVRYFHFICIFGLVSSVIAEHLLLKPQMTRQEIKRLALIDSIYGLSAILVVAAGLTLWFWVGKPADFYSKNWIFHTKVTMAVLMGLLSIYPTIFFIKQSKGPMEELVEMPPAIKWSIRLELLLIFSIPLLATFMAKGIGYFGD
jgi:putative membrane protein